MSTATMAASKASETATTKWGGPRPGSGRHKKECACERCEARRAEVAHVDVDPAVSHTITLRESKWQWLATWGTSLTPSGQFSDFIDRGQVFWPAGPQSCNATSKAKQRALWEQLADELGLEGDARVRLLTRHAPAMMDLLMGGEG